MSGMIRPVVTLVYALVLSVGVSGVHADRSSENPSDNAHHAWSWYFDEDRGVEGQVASSGIEREEEQSHVPEVLLVQESKGSDEKVLCV